MTSEETQIEKLKLISWITQVQKSSLLAKLKAFKISLEEDNDWYDFLSEEQKNEIEASIKSLRAGICIYSFY